MKIVIQCASGKQAGAGYVQTEDGKRVMFVAQPQFAPPFRHEIVARPDDQSDRQVSWRMLLQEYNKSPGNNPWNLRPAFMLYKNGIYRRLADRFGVERVYILSAGWGLIRADFLTPQYDITFSSRAEDYKRRARPAPTKNDLFQDFQMLQDDADDSVMFFGGKDYLPLFCRLTENFRCRRKVFYNSATPPNARGCDLQRYKGKPRTNWHYECAKALLVSAVEA